GLRAGLELDRRRAGDVVLERVDLDLAAERGLDERDIHLGEDVFVVALEALVALHVQDNVEVTGGAARRGFTFTGEAERLTVVDAGGDGDLQCRLLGARSATAALVARFLDLLARAAALRARGLDHEEALRVHDLTFAAARAAGLDLAAG